MGYKPPGEYGLAWTAGPRTKPIPPGHICADLDAPSWATALDDGSFLIADAGHDRICRLEPERGLFGTFIDLRPHGVNSPANCILDSIGRIWINYPTLPRLWVFTRSGTLLRALGNPGAAQGDPGSGQRENRERPLEDMDLGEVYDMRCGPDGLMYILEGARFRLRAIDFQRNLVLPVAGSGRAGYSGDGGEPRAAAFGGARTRRFDGPWAFCLSPDNAVYIGDTQNSAVRMIDPDRKSIATIAGGRMTTDGPNPAGRTDPFALAFPSISWMDWGAGKLFVTDRNGDLVTLSHPPESGL